MLTADTLTTTAQSLRFNADEFGNDPEFPKEAICRTSDGRIHAVLAGKTAGWWHVISSDDGATWNATEVESTTLTTNVALTTDGTGILLRYDRSGRKFRAYDGSTWGAESDCPWVPDESEVHFCCTSDGAAHVVFQEDGGNEYHHYTRASLTSGEWTGPTVFYPYGYLTEDEYTPWYFRLEGLFAHGTNLWLTYQAYGGGTGQIACVQHFDGSSWGEAFVLGTSNSNTPANTGDTRIDCGIAIHVAADGTVYAAWNLETYENGVDTDTAFTFCVREFSGSSWGDVITRPFTFGDDSLFYTGPFYTPALASDGRGVVYAFFGGYTPDWGQAVYYTLKDKNGWSDDYGIAAIDPDDVGNGYVRYQPHTLNTARLDEGCVVSCYAAGDTYEGTDLIFLLDGEVEAPVRVLPSKVRHLWLCNLMGNRAILRNAR